MSSRRSHVRTSALLLAVWVLLWSGQALVGGEIWFFHDLRHHHLPWRAWAAWTWAAGEIPLWAPVAHGYPLLADGQAGVLYLPDRLLYLLLPVGRAFAWSIALHQALAAVGGLALARVTGRSLPASMVAGVAFGTSGALLAHMVYLPMFQVMAWLPWVAAATWMATERGGGWWVGAGALLGLSWLAGHPQLALYSSYTAAFLVLWRTVELRRARTWRPLAGLAVAAVVAGVLAGPQLVATLELVGHGARAGGVDPAFAAMGSLPPEELVHGLFPTVFGYERPADILLSYHHRAGGYTGRGVSFVEDTFYLGVPVVLLALGAGLARRGRVWWALAAVGLLVMLGPLTPVFHAYRLLPGVSGLRFPVRASILVTLAVSQLAALGVDRLTAWLYARPAWVARRAWGVVGLAVVGVLLASALHMGLDQGRAPLEEALTARLVRPEGDPAAPGGAVEARGPEEARVRASAILDELSESTRIGSRRVFFPAGLAILFAVPWLVASRGQVQPQLPGRLAWVVVALDLTAFGHDFNPTLPESVALERPESAVALLGVPGVYRTTTVGRRGDADLDTQLLSANLGLLWGQEDVIVPSPLRSSRNDAYLEAAGLDLGLDPVEDKLARLAERRHLLDLSGVRYILTEHELELPDLELVRAVDLGEHVVRVYHNPRALPRAFAVGCTRSAGSGEESLDALVSLPESPGAVAVVEGEGLSECVPGRVGEVEAERVSSSHLRAEVDLPAEAWLVITESSWPGQELRIDGERVESTRTDYLFIGVRVPAGQHTVDLRYRPRAVLAALGVAALGWLALLGWGLVVIVRRSREG